MQPEKHKVERETYLKQINSLSRPLLKETQKYTYIYIQKNLTPWKINEIKYH